MHAVPPPAPAVPPLDPPFPAVPPLPPVPPVPPAVPPCPALAPAEPLVPPPLVPPCPADPPLEPPVPPVSSPAAPPAPPMSSSEPPMPAIVLSPPLPAVAAGVPPEPACAPPEPPELAPAEFVQPFPALGPSVESSEPQPTIKNGTIARDPRTLDFNMTHSSQHFNDSPPVSFASRARALTTHKVRSSTLRIASLMHDVQCHRQSSAEQIRNWQLSLDSAIRQRTRAFCDQERECAIAADIRNGQRVVMGKFVGCCSFAGQAKTLSERSMLARP